MCLWLPCTWMHVYTFITYVIHCIHCILYINYNYLHTFIHFIHTSVMLVSYLLAPYTCPCLQHHTVNIFIVVFSWYQMLESTILSRMTRVNRVTIYTSIMCVWCCRCECRWGASLWGGDGHRPHKTNVTRHWWHRGGQEVTTWQSIICITVLDNIIININLQMHFYCPLFTWVKLWKYVKEKVNPISNKWRQFQIVCLFVPGEVQWLY